MQENIFTEQMEKPKKNKNKFFEIKRGDLKKRNRFLVNQTRTFVLTSEPRLKYYKNGVDFRREIALTEDAKVKLTGNGIFSITTPKKTY